MKKKFLIIIFIMAMFLTGCDGNKNNDNDKDTIINSSSSEENIVGDRDSSNVVVTVGEEIDYYFSETNFKSINLEGEILGDATCQELEVDFKPYVSSGNTDIEKLKESYTNLVSKIKEAEKCRNDYINKQNEGISPDDYRYLEEVKLYQNISINSSDAYFYAKNTTEEQELEFVTKLLKYYFRNQDSSDDSYSTVDSFKIFVTLYPKKINNKFAGYYIKYDMVNNEFLDEYESLRKEYIEKANKYPNSYMDLFNIPKEQSNSDYSLFVDISFEKLYANYFYDILTAMSSGYPKDYAHKIIASYSFIDDIKFIDNKIVYDFSSDYYDLLKNNKHKELEKKLISNGLLITH